MTRPVLLVALCLAVCVVSTTRATTNTTAAPAPLERALSSADQEPRCGPGGLGLRCGGPFGGPTAAGMGPGDQKKLDAMTPEERGAHFEKLFQDRKAVREKLKSMTQEERRAFFRQRFQEKLATLPADKRKLMEERMKKMQEHLQKRSSKDRQIHRGRRFGDKGPGQGRGPEQLMKLEAMTPAERMAFFEKRFQERKAMRDKLRSMSPEERQAVFLRRMQERHGDLAPDQMKKLQERFQRRRQRFEQLEPDGK
ncbi:MAG: hypothetical protein HY815_28255 [Candidatus Riflebacteria bacterium]|nr:hypothetical protein [Candidatus Riflebacteria bacterium]